jgi:hypothetical protein
MAAIMVTHVSLLAGSHSWPPPLPDRPLDVGHEVGEDKRDEADGSLDQQPRLLAPARVGGIDSKVSACLTDPAAPAIG